MLFGWILYAVDPRTASGRSPRCTDAPACSAKTASLARGTRIGARRWATAGYVVLFPDSYGSRGLGPQCKTAERRAPPAANASTMRTRRYISGSGARISTPSRFSLVGLVERRFNGAICGPTEKQPDEGERGRGLRARHCLLSGLPDAAGDRPLEDAASPAGPHRGGFDDWTPWGPLRRSDRRRDGQERTRRNIHLSRRLSRLRPPEHARPQAVEGLAFTADGDGQAHTGTNPEARANAIERVMEFLRR